MEVKDGFIEGNFYVGGDVRVGDGPQKKRDDVVYPKYYFIFI